MSAEPRWIPLPIVLAIHDLLMAEHGGARGRADEARLSAALARPRHKHAFGESDLFILAAAHAFAVARGHPFMDGNKRVALTLAGVFLELNGWRLAAPEADAAHMTIALAADSVSEVAYAEWLREQSVRALPPGTPA